MSLYIVDVEADGPIPGVYSMVCFGAVKVTREKEKATFYGETKPISKLWIPEALSVSGFSREEHLSFKDPTHVMLDFKDWVSQTNTEGRPIFMSDNLAFDWQWINWYFHNFLQENPFGFSGRRIGDLVAGATKNFKNTSEWKKYRTTVHDHNPVNDALGNAEALIKIIDFYDIKNCYVS